MTADRRRGVTGPSLGAWGGVGALLLSGSLSVWALRAVL